MPEVLLNRTIVKLRLYRGVALLWDCFPNLHKCALPLRSLLPGAKRAFVARGVGIVTGA